jgi:trehalose synthase-fused probable maltokinase
MIRRLVAALRAVDNDLDWRDLADVLWLSYATERRPRVDDGPLAPPIGATGATADGEAADPAVPPVARRDTPESTADSAPDRGHAQLQALRRGATRQGGGLTFDVRTPANYALPGRLEIGRALRPLKQHRRSRLDQVFDTEATIDHYCDTGVLVPITAPTQERWFHDVALIADGSLTMVVWQETIAALAELLELHGAFDRVTRWTLTGGDDEVYVVSLAGLRHDPHELVDYDGRRLTLVVTDCVGPLWRGPAVWAALRDWGCFAPVALVQTLPPRLWAATALGDADVAMTSHRRGEPNRQLGLRPPWWWDADGSLEHATPVVTLDEQRLGAWAHMVMGAAGIEVAGVVTQPPHPGGPAPAASPMDAEARVASFRATVSEEASRLATLLSAIDVSLPVARLVLDKLIPGARQTHLAEVLVSGLLQPSALANEPSSVDTYDFLPGVRELLQDSLTTTTTIDVWRTVTPYLEATTGQRPPFSLLLDQDPSVPTDAYASVLGSIAADVINRLGLTSPLPSRSGEVDVSPSQDQTTVPENIRSAAEGEVVFDFGEPPDLTVMIRASTRPGEFSWSYHAPLVDIPREPEYFAISEDAEIFSRNVRRQISVRTDQRELTIYLRGLGRAIAEHIPQGFWDVLVRVAEAVRPRPPTMLLLSNEPEIRWDLAVLDSPLDPALPSILGCQAVLSYWILPQARGRGVPPSSAAAGETMAVISGVYEAQLGFRPLPIAEEEAASLGRRYGARMVNADTSSVLQVLGEDPGADVLHFTGHGDWDPKGAGLGFVLVDGRMLDPLLVQGTGLHSAPFVFLNASDTAGMAGPFIRAGASAVVAPAWAISDETARQVALDFYRSVLEDGHRPADVLRRLRCDAFSSETLSAGTLLAYEYFGHPSLTLRREQPVVPGDRPKVDTPKDQPPRLSSDLLLAMQSELSVSLIPYLRDQRWYSGRGRRLQGVRIQLIAALSGGSPALVEVIVAAVYADGGVERYQVPCGLRTGDDVPSFKVTHPRALIGSFEWSGRPAIIYDAVYDPDLGPVLLELLRQESRFDELHFYLQPLEVDSPVELRANASRLLSGEQTNSSLVYDDRFILKLFRRLHDGENPELEIPRFLAAEGFTAIAEPLGWIDGPGSTLAVLQRYYPGSETGWEIAVRSVGEAYHAPDRDLSSLENDFAPHASLLGTLTADLHIALAKAFDTVIAEEADLVQTNAWMRDHLHQVSSEVHELDLYRPEIEELYTAVEATATRLQLQRIHGDYHLNQVLRVGDRDWLVIDFEGEPVRNLEERRRLLTPLRDVAGMLRSFDYAASHPLLDRPELAGLEQRAVDWSTHNRTAFLNGYIERAAPAGLLPDAYELLLFACEVDKAVYEVRYEARYRPKWLPIPLQGIQRLLANYQNFTSRT